MDLAYAPGTKSVYSDLGFFLLGEVLERVAGEPIDAFVTRRVFEPLGMKSTMFCPSRDLVSCILRRARRVAGPARAGRVHDENAFAVGGVAAMPGSSPPRATSPARFAQMLLNGGVYDGHRIVSRATVERFTKRAECPTRPAPTDGTLPIRPLRRRHAVAARLRPHRFTGTSMWIDPERNLFVILLTNRVHPTRENDTIRQVRRQVADAVVTGLVRAMTRLARLWPSPPCSSRPPAGDNALTGSDPASQAQRPGAAASARPATGHPGRRPCRPGGARRGEGRRPEGQEGGPHHPCRSVTSKGTRLSTCSRSTAWRSCASSARARAAGPCGRRREGRERQGPEIRPPAGEPLRREDHAVPRGRQGHRRARLRPARRRRALLHVREHAAALPRRGRRRGDRVRRPRSAEPARGRARRRAGERSRDAVPASPSTWRPGRSSTASRPVSAHTCSAYQPFMG